MKIVREIFFPAMMVLGIVLSAFVIANSLQAAPRAPQNVTSAPKVVPALNAVAQGRALFVAKGCFICHRHAAFTQERAALGDFYFEDVPNLSQVQADPQYLSRWLANPQEIKPNTEMPDLNLSAEEIGALVAFLTQNQ